MKKNFLKVLIFLILINTNTFSSHDTNLKLRPFTTDGCTGFFNGTQKDPNLWLHCCIEHDIYLWAGGTKNSRYKADQRLKNCVEATGEKWIANLMYIAVRLGSYSPIKLKTKKWGNGWNPERPNTPLTIDEILLIEEELTKNNYDFDFNIIRKALENIKKDNHF
jgi:hypothetical protein